ncbi:TetR/AcrR family transcriptional regulator [Allosalinactinospora lopnorensis]|uniref:TetR/AcrR family transcriptional regulator n=1 Tax=Allosalinactinospora lopnorensis TaxID=1352348 RepID=UPI000623DCB2|nr:TetR/AcrR family transcriptional regulator [Allosalinactinospora lopnorensis]
MSKPAPARDKRASVSRGRTNRREEILRAAADVFAAQGFHNASLTDIAATLGITPAGILHHFGSKTGLLTAVLELRDSADPPPKDERLLDHLVSTAERSAAHPETTRLYAVLSTESTTDGHPARTWFRNRYRELRGEVELAILDRLDSAHGRAGAEEPAESGDRVPREVRDAATAVVAVLDGLQAQWLLDPDAVDMAAVTRTVIDALLTRLDTAGAPDKDADPS